MRLLLDTHIAVWLLADDSRLSSRVKALLTDQESDLIVSVVTLWEIAIKRALRRGDQIGMPYSSRQTHDLLLRSGADILPVTPEHAFAVERLPTLHRDPFDRLLVAQALSEPLRLVTHDADVAAYSDTVILV
jgi:PIN domain nuclease of toxin-antitoxin system